MLARELALKLGRKPLDDASPAERDELVNEARTLAALRHDGLVNDLRLASSTTAGPTWCSTWSWGRTSRSTPGRAASTRWAAEVVGRLSRVVGHRHARGVVHRDIKPRNVMIDDRGQPRLIDLGLARLRYAWAPEPEAPSGGTPTYLVPEQARGEAEAIGPPADVFGLAGALDFLLTGRAPYAGASRPEVLARARLGEYDARALREAHAPERLKVICRRGRSPPTRLAGPLLRMRWPTTWRDSWTGLGPALAGPPLLAVTAVLIVVAIGAAVALLSGPQPRPTLPSAPAPPRTPLRVESFEVELHRRDPPRPLGPIGVEVFEARYEDDVRVRARFQAYCYLIALNPDGKIHSAPPKTRRVAPAHTAEINFPSNPAIGFGLTDGVGLQAFVLVVSREACATAVRRLAAWPR